MAIDDKNWKKGIEDYAGSRQKTKEGVYKISLRLVPISIIIAYAVISLNPFTNDSDVRHFSKSIDIVNQATSILNSGKTYRPVEQREIDAMLEYYRQALSVAKKVNIQKLNSDYQDLGNHYHDQFVVGLQMVVEGFENDDSRKLL